MNHTAVTAVNVNSNLSVQLAVTLNETHTAERIYGIIFFLIIVFL